MQLTKTFTQEQFDRALESWAWLGLEHKVPMFSSLFGDVFLDSPDGWWFLDTLDGSIDLKWETEQELLNELGTDAGEDRYLMGVLALAAEAKGVILGDDDVYDFMPAPVLGGGFSVENIYAQNFMLKVNIAGQIHEQISKMPPGSQITGFKLG